MQWLAEGSSLLQPREADCAAHAPGDSELPVFRLLSRSSGESPGLPRNDEVGGVLLLDRCEINSPPPEPAAGSCTCSVAELTAIVPGLDALRLGAGGRTCRGCGELRPLV